LQKIDIGISSNLQENWLVVPPQLPRKAPRQ